MIQICQLITGYASTMHICCLLLYLLYYIAIKFFIFSMLFFPGSFSTPVETSNIVAPVIFIASITLFAFSPPAKNHGLLTLNPLIIFQLKLITLPPFYLLIKVQSNALADVNPFGES